MRAALILTLALALGACAKQPSSTLQPVVESNLEGFSGFRPLPPEDPAMNARLAAMVEEVGLAERTPADKTPGDGEEWSSVCLVDLRDPRNPRTAGWEAENFVYPASSYKLYVLGEAIRQVCVGKLSLEDKLTVAPHNDRGDNRIKGGDTATLAEVLRLMMQYSDNTAANVAIDTIDRRNATALLHAMGCQGSEVTRKFLPRAREDEGYADVPGTVSSARHFATFIYAVENGCIGGGKGRGLIKGYMSLISKPQDRFFPALPESATIYAKTGWWNVYTSEAALVEDGETKYILCVMTAQTSSEASPKMGELAKRVHAWMKEGS